MAGDRRMLSSMEPEPELTAAVNLTKLNTELNNMDQHCQLFAETLNASKPGNMTHFDKQLLKVTFRLIV